MMNFRTICLFAVCILMPSLEALKPDLFYAKMKEPAPEWMMDQIGYDLSPYTKELSRKYLDEIFTEHSEINLFRVQVVNGKITVQKSEGAKTHPVPDQIIQPLYVLSTLVLLPDFDCIFSADDETECLFKDEPLPVFMLTKKKHDFGLILFPDWYALKGFEPERTEVLEGNLLYPWESKLPILFFRGGDSGIKDPSRWVNYPRPRLMELSVQHPDLIDAKFNYLHHRQYWSYASKRGYLGDFVPIRENGRYKYEMDIDGNCAATPRLPLLMHSNSVILKNTTDSMLWFYPTLKAYVHYIPVAEDLSDIFTQLEWAKTHDDQCRKISENARQLAAEIFSPESIYLYFYRLLKEYSKKQAVFYNE
ncbi:MAG TPA: glycosyl transferase family 90 [Rhabdochlamydiaceae bacterium]|nr:glycosyl transferase family 90 [Rhabdochlamydiaceae bacterium]